MLAPPPQPYVNILQKDWVVKLNASWVAFDTLTISAAVTFLHSERKSDGTIRKPGFVIDYQTEEDENGQHVLITQPRAVDWEEWLTLPLLDNQPSIGISGGLGREPRRIRAPLLVITAHYRDIPTITPKLTKEAVLIRDDFTCQYSGRRLPRKQLNLDHVRPKSRGGKDRDWLNLVACDVRLNSEKGDRTPEEMGWKLLRKPVAPKARAKVLRVEDARHPSQIPFLLK